MVGMRTLTLMTDDLRSGTGFQGRGRPADEQQAAYARPASRNEPRLGRIVAVRPVPATASSVFRPSPVFSTTVGSEGSNRRFPIARDLAMVFGFWGRTTSWPALYATDTGEHPSACAPKILYGLSSTSPS